MHSRPQSPSFLGHVVKPSGSGDENRMYAEDC